MKLKLTAIYEYTYDVSDIHFPGCETAEEKIEMERKEFLDDPWWILEKAKLKKLHIIEVK